MFEQSEQGDMYKQTLLQKAVEQAGKFLPTVESSRQYHPRMSLREGTVCSSRPASSHEWACL